MTKFTIGCDPEMFLRVGDTPISAHGLITGTKKNPTPVDSGAYQVDGLAVEFNTTPVALEDFTAFNANVVFVVKQLKAAVQAANPKAQLVIEPVMEFGKEFLDAQPDEAKELGCDPDYNAYTKEINPIPDGDRPFRTAAGHIHIGWGADIPVENPEHIEICAEFVKTLDLTVGLFMTYIDRDPRRRELYGKAGAFRPKPYGVEYRTPSNVWLKNKAYRHGVQYFTSLAVSIQKYPNRYRFLQDYDAREIINKGDYAAASKIIERIFHQDYYGNYKTPGWWRTVKTRLLREETVSTTSVE